MNSSGLCLNEILIRSTVGSYLRLSRRNLPQININDLQSYLYQNAYISEIWLEPSRENENIDIIPFLKCLCLIKSIHTLNLKGNHLTKAELDQVARLVSINNAIVHLNLENNLLDSKSAIIMAGMLRRHDCSLETLSLNENSLGDAGVIHITNAINSNENFSLSRLNLNTNDIRHHGLKALASMMQSNATIKHLNLNYMNLTENGDNKPLLDIIDFELKKNIQNNEEKIQTLAMTRHKLKLLDCILFCTRFQKETGHRQGLIDLRECTKSSLPVLEKWNKMKEIVALRKDTPSTYIPLLFGGRNLLTQDIYDCIENDRTGKLEELKNTYDFGEEFCHLSGSL